jgi:predicted methyltransferase
LIFDIPAPSRRRLLSAAVALALASCSKKASAPTADPAASAAPTGTLGWAVAGPWRSGADRQRDKAMHPIETLEFFGLAPGQTVVEMWPGSGWWTEILGPYLTANKGKLYGATFETPNPDDPAAGPVVDGYRKMIADKPDLYGAVTITAFGPHSGMLAPAGTADLVLFFDLDHWMAAGLAEKAFHDAFAALKPGGVLGVVQARANPGGEQDPVAANGYVQEAFVKQLAAEAGFTFDTSSEVNADPDDRKDAKRPSLFAAAMEPDRTTLRFLKKV